MISYLEKVYSGKYKCFFKIIVSGRNAPVFILFTLLSVCPFSPGTRHRPYKSGVNFYYSNTALNRIQKKEEKKDSTRYKNRI